MDRLYSWEAKRAGAAITITHSCGKIVGITGITRQGNKVVAVGGDGRSYELA